MANRTNRAKRKRTPATTWAWISIRPGMKKGRGRTYDPFNKLEAAWEKTAKEREERNGAS